MFVKTSFCFQCYFQTVSLASDDLAVTWIRLWPELDYVPPQHTGLRQFERLAQVKERAQSQLLGQFPLIGDGVAHCPVCSDWERALSQRHTSTCTIKLLSATPAMHKDYLFPKLVVQIWSLWLAFFSSNETPMFVTLYILPRINVLWKPDSLSGLA